MKKNLLIGLLIGASLIFSGCSDKKLNEKDKGAYTNGTVSPGVVIGQKLKDFAIADQFGNINTLTNKTKKSYICSNKSFRTCS